ncbi:MAG: M56 family metallopeptidase [Saccharofermentanales bacterium]|jgi:beta-lactamase regulating signal transducer with metallopeptidase domain
MLDFLFASLMGALFIVIVMLFRKFTKEIYRSGMIMILWGIVLLRLLIPFNPLGANAPVTLSVPDRGVVDTPTEQQNPAAMFPAEQADKPDVRSEIEDSGGQAKNPNAHVDIGNLAEEQGQHQPEDAIQKSELAVASSGLSYKLLSFVKQLTLVEILFYVWLAGALVSVLYLIFARISFMRSIHDGIVRLEEDEKLKFVPANIPVFVTDKEFGPLVVGPLKPYLIVPRSLLSKTDAEDKKERQKVQLALQHEVMHVRRKDLWVKALYLVARAIHWFNPLVWFMGDLLNQDIEYACDEALTLDLSKEEKVDYCQALLDLVKTGSVKSDNFSSRFTGDAEMLKTRINKIIHGPLLKRGRMIALSLALIVGVSLILVSCTPKTQGSTSTDHDVSTTIPDN